MKYEGFVTVDVVDTKSGVLLDSREVENMVFDAYRMLYFFIMPSYNYAPKMNGWGNVFLYLSEYASTITQSSYSGISTYAVSSAISPSAAWSNNNNTVTFTYATQSYAGQSPTRTLSCVGIQNAIGSGIISAVSIVPAVIHDSTTTVYLHYKLRVTLDDNDNLFGLEGLYRYPNTIQGVFNYCPGTGDIMPLNVAMPGYKKYYYTSLLCRKTRETAGTNWAYADNSVDPYMFHYNYMTIQNNIISGTIYLVNTPGTYRAWCGPYGGQYEMRCSALGAGLIYNPHISRIFAHMGSVSNKIFYDSTEADIPQSLGTLTTDVTGCPYDIYTNPTGLKYPSAYRLLFTAQGDVGVAQYRIQEWVMPSQNTFLYPWGFFAYHWQYDDSYANYCISSSNIYFKQMYVSGNRNWWTYRFGNTSFETVPSYAESRYYRPYIFIGYKGLQRWYGATWTIWKYVINNSGIFYYTKFLNSTWVLATSYAVGDKVQFNQYDWTCTVAHTSAYNYYPGNGTYNYWTAAVDAVNVYWADMDADQQNPTEHLLCDITVACSGHGITGIRGLAYDDDNNWLWVATNVGFVQIDLDHSGGPSYTFYDHNTVGFGDVMSGVADVIIYDQWNGRFVAERGRLTWVRSNATTIWHWTGDRYARSINSPATVQNLFVDYDRQVSGSTTDVGIIGIVRSNYQQVIRIGNAATGLVSTYTGTQSLGSGSYSCGMEAGFFWWCNSNYTYTAPGTNGLAMKGYINLTSSAGLINSVWTTSYYITEQQTASTPPSLINHATGINWCSPNKSIVEGVMTICCSNGSYQVMMADCGPIYWGWDGVKWVAGLGLETSAVKTTTGNVEVLPHNVKVIFNNAVIPPSYYLGDYYSFGVNPRGIYLDNLQTAYINIDMYGYHASLATDGVLDPYGRLIYGHTIVVPGGGIYTIPERTSSVTESKTYTRGAVVGGTDYIHESLTSINSVTQGGTTYNVTTDWVLSGTTISWAPLGAEPAAGTSYVVNYTFNNFVNMVAWSGDPHVKVTFTDLSVGAVAWTLGNSYVIGNRVSFGGVFYSCILAHTATAANAPPFAGCWSIYEYGSIVNIVGTWSALSTYSVGQRVYYTVTGLYYYCIQNTTAGIVPTNISYWSPWNTNAKQVLYDYNGTISFDVSHVGETVIVQYAWMSRAIV